ncbi:hypothetical protein ACQQCD_08585 [Pseudarthrobacter sp. J1763]|uniref:hypothetical protein n=1 Tax=Pseudarthrobacter sp. J1763 TaxID=3420445 RepID=UPI003D2C64E4
MPFSYSWPTWLPVALMVGAAAVYALLRWIVWTPREGSNAVSISQHALWVGILGWVFSSLQNTQQPNPFGSIPGHLAVPSGLPGPDQSQLHDLYLGHWLSEQVPALLLPVLAVLGIHALGQLSYPGPRRSTRQAALVVRRIGDFLPRVLSWVTAACFVSSAVFIALLIPLPGFSPMDAGVDADGVAQFGAQSGRLEGWFVAASLGGGLVLLAAGTVAVLALITRRRAIETLSTDEDHVLRRIAINRLLRTVATIAAGLGVTAAAYSRITMPTDNFTGTSGSWINIAGIINMAILVVMFLWHPPALNAYDGAASGWRAGAAPLSSPEARATRLVTSVGTAMPLGGLVAIILVVAGWGATFNNQEPWVSVTAAGVGSLIALCAGELLLQRNYCGNRGESPVNAVEPRTSHWVWTAPWLLWTTVAAAIIVAGAITVAAIGPRLWEMAGGASVTDSQANPDLSTSYVVPVPAWIGASVCCAVIVLVSVLCVVVASRRQSLTAGSPARDKALRQITVYRAVKLLAASWLGIAGVVLASAVGSIRMLQDQPNGYQALTSVPVGQWIGIPLIAVAVILCVIPPSTKLTATGALRLPRSASLRDG